MRPFSVAVTGKGGTGKTTLAALLVRVLIEAGESPVLAVDADPNANLHEALGVEVKKTLGSMREESFKESIPPGMTRTEFMELRFRQAIVEERGFDLVAMGLPEGTGCYCFANDVLQRSIAMLRKEYRFIVIDNEAGMEHISRGTIGIPDLLIIVSDPGARGIRTAARIRDLAKSLGLSSVPQVLVVNRWKGKSSEGIPGAPDIGIVIPEDPAVEAADLAGSPVGAIPPGSPAREAVRRLAQEILRRAKEKGNPSVS